MKAINRRLQPRPAEDLLRHALQAVLEIDGDIRSDIVLGNFLLFDQNQRFRLDRWAAKTSSTAQTTSQQKTAAEKSTRTGAATMAQ